jgi:hypothetical protein
MIGRRDEQKGSPPPAVGEPRGYSRIASGVKRFRLEADDLEPFFSAAAHRCSSGSARDDQCGSQSLVSQVNAKVQPILMGSPEDDDCIRSPRHIGRRPNEKEARCRDERHRKGEKDKQNANESPPCPPVAAQGRTHQTDST